MSPEPAFSNDILKLNPREEVESICKFLRQRLLADLHRRGLIVALSGGIDSSVTAALAAKALGTNRVLGLLMPERHSAPETLELSRSIAESFNVPYVHEDISGILEAVGFYRRYDNAVRKIIPNYGNGWRSKIVIPNILSNKGFRLYSIVAQDNHDHKIKKRLPLKVYLEIVATTNFKQRIRKMMEYYHADRLNFAVAGTPNRLEHDQGFFVKLGDGAADIKPIAHLYKSQVYQLAEYLGVPEEIRRRSPTSDIYSLPQGQDEFYFSLPYDKMDLCLYAHNQRIPADTVAPVLGFSSEQVRRIFDNIETKRITTRYLHLPALLACDI